MSINPVDSTTLFILLMAGALAFILLCAWLVARAGVSTRAKFSHWQDTPGGYAIPQFTIMNGDQKWKTVGEKKLGELGINIPPIP